MMKIGESIFLFSPNSVAVISSDERGSLGKDITGEDEKRGSFFSR